MTNDPRLAIVELTITREEFDRGYLTWGGACCTCHGYTLIRELPDGCLLARGCVSQETTCQIEDWIAASARKAWKMYGGKPVPTGRTRTPRRGEMPTTNGTESSDPE